MSTEEDYAKVTEAVPSPASGITFCTGSLGARPTTAWARIYFLHLRNVKREGNTTPGSFHEAEHLGDDTDMVAVVAAVLRENPRRHEAGRADSSIPFRPDHGQASLDDKSRKAQQGLPPSAA